MAEAHWILVVEPRESDRMLIERAVGIVDAAIEVVFVKSYDDFIAKMATQGSLPSVAILDWYVDDGPAGSIDTLYRLGFLSRLPIVAIARENPMQALDESFQLGVQRFVSKRPDDFCFQKKLAEAISECLIGARKSSPINRAA